MKTAKIKVNRSPESPEGVEIEIVQPQNDLEGRLLSYMLTNAVREAKREERIPYKLPSGFAIKHQGEGTFAVIGTPGPKDTAAPTAGGGYYQPPRPLAIVGIRVAGNSFDLIHAEIDPARMKKAGAGKASAAGS